MNQKARTKELKLQTLSSVFTVRYMVVGSVQDGYGIKVTVHDIQTDEMEQEQINGIFITKEEAEIFCDLLVEHQVTPTTLRDVAEDYILME